MHAIADCDEGPKRSSQDAPGSARVLILDTDPDLRNVLAGCLLELGYEVACAARADEAVRLVANALCEERSFEVVILDITERDAEQSLRAFSTMCRLDPEIRVIVPAPGLTEPGSWITRASGLRRRSRSHGASSISR